MKLKVNGEVKKLPSQLSEDINSVMIDKDGSKLYIYINGVEVVFDSVDYNCDKLEVELDK